MVKLVDARGLSCPQPVILSRKALQEKEFPLEVVVDTVTARDNVSRAMHKEGYRVTVAEREGGFVVTVEKAS